MDAWVEIGGRYTAEGWSRSGKTHPANTWRGFPVLGFVPRWGLIVVQYDDGSTGTQRLSAQDYWGALDVPNIDSVAHMERDEQDAWMRGGEMSRDEDNMYNPWGED